VSLVLTDLQRGVLTVTLADEARRNALSADLTGELVPILDDADHDPSIRVVVLTHTGTTFCAGADLAARTSEGRSAAAAALDPRRLFGRFRSSPKPYVGRIAGHCVAGGMGLAAGLDITVAARSAKFGFTEVRVGVAPAMISVVCLPKMKLADAQAAFLRGNRFSADEAQRIGLVTYAVDDDQLDTTVTSVVDDLLAGGPEALAASKELLAQVPSMSTEDAFEWTATLSARLFAGDEAKEGTSAFLEKRKAKWVP
jgi:methylglutaconyl-CoA hydratase